MGERSAESASEMLATKMVLRLLASERTFELEFHGELHQTYRPRVATWLSSGLPTGHACRRRDRHNPIASDCGLIPAVPLSWSPT